MAFNLTRALCSKALVARNLQLCKINPHLYGASSRAVTMKVYPAPPPIVETHDEKAVRLRRPQSPHLTVYTIQLTAFLSITHRMTGAWLTGYAALFGLGAIALPGGAESIVQGCQFAVDWAHVNAPVLMATKFVIAWPLTYHAANGIRHLVWDIGKCLGIKEVYSTGYLMYISSCVGAALCAIL